jgi:hypothetical protein
VVEKEQNEQKDDVNSAENNMLSPNPYLVATSITFVIPTTLAAYKQVWSQYVACLLIIIVSSLYHSTKNEILFWLDQVVCIALTINSIKLALKHKLYAIPATGITYILTMYYGGYVTKTLIWSPDLTVATISHMSMHIVTNILVTYVIQ